MSLILKMQLESVTKQIPGTELAVSYKLRAVSGEENKPWSKYTPAGDLNFTVTNPEAEELEPGASYLVTIAKV